MTTTGKEGEGTNPLVAAILGGQAPLQLKISAVRGVLPLERTELLRILVVLAQDSEGQVSKEARSRLAEMPDEELVPILEDPGAPPDLLRHFGREHGQRESLIEAVLGNSSAPIGFLKEICLALTATQIDRLLLNQTRLIENPDLLDVLSGNKNLKLIQRSRIDEIWKHFINKQKEKILAEPQPEPEPEPAAVAETGGPDDGGTESVEPIRYSDSANQKIMRMNVPEKIMLALKGSREERSILIMDSSKVVKKAVLESPRMTDQEIEKISKMRSATEELLRMIASNRDWMKSYSIMHGLATNPKTPPSISINMVNRFNDKDLKVLARDRDVPEVLRRRARQILDQKEKKRQKHH